jgi:hypothetical protein
MAAIKAGTAQRPKSKPAANSKSEVSSETTELSSAPTDGEVSLLVMRSHASKDLAIQ